MTTIIDFTAQDAQAVAFLKRYRGAIHWAINRECVPEQVREDIFQDVSARILKRFRRSPLNEDLNTMGYAVMVARNASMDHYRNRRMKLVPLYEGLNLHSTDRPADEQMDRLDAHERLHACIASLPPLCRAIMRMVVEGKSQYEIAQCYEISLVNVRQIMWRGRAKLREKLTSTAYR